MSTTEPSRPPAPADRPSGTARAVIADDERLMREQLRARLAEVWPAPADRGRGQERTGGGRAGAAAPARDRVPRHPHARPHRRGCGAANPADADLADDEVLPEIVFITAYDQYAVQAFEQGVADYVLKPAERDRLALTVTRIQQRLTARDGADACVIGPGHAPGAAAAAPAGRAAQPGQARPALPGVDPGHRGPGDPDDPGGRGAVLHQR